MSNFKQYINEIYINDQDIINVLFESDFDIDEAAEFETIIYEKSQRGSLKDQVWGDVKGKTEEERIQSVKEIYKKALQDAQTNYKVLSRGLKLSTRKVKDPKILVDIKKEDSFVDKVVKRGTPANKIHDILRSAVIVKDKDVDNVVKQIKKNFKIVKYTFKSKGGDKEFGYFGSHHFLVEIGSMNAEVQVMSRRLWAFKEEAHKIYTKLRSDSKFSSDLEKKFKNMSKILFAKGNKAFEKRKAVAYKIDS